jgi:hypothetical protein
MTLSRFAENGCLELLTKVRVALLSVFVVGPAAAAERLDVGEVYEACLVGRFVIEELAATPVSDPFAAALESCAEFRAAVPEDYPGTEAESYGPGLIEETVIHMIDSGLLDRAESDPN